MTKKIFTFLMLFSFHSLASDFDLVGSYLLEYSVFKIDVYKISYFKGKETEKLVLDYKIDVKKEHSLEGWKVGLAHKMKDDLFRQKAQWIFDHTSDAKKGDSFIIIKTGQLIEFQMNEKLLGKTTDPIIAELAFEPWLGEKPIDKNLKASLLGTNK